MDLRKAALLAGQLTPVGLSAVLLSVIMAIRRGPGRAEAA